MNYMPNFVSLYAYPGLIGGDEWYYNIDDLDWRDKAGPKIVRGLQNSNDPLQNYWDGANDGKNMFIGIRDCNIFLENIHRVPDLEEYEMSVWSAEIKVVKAFFHLFLLQLYGPIPVIRENAPVNASPAEVRVFREPVDDVVDYIAELIDEAAPNLMSSIESPLEPPVHAIIKTMNFMEDFGGVVVKWENPTKTEMCFNFMASDSTGTLQDFDIVFNQQAAGSFAMRGFDTQERLFGVHLRDKWGNKSDTFFVSRKPLYEENLNRFAAEKYYEVALPGDNTSNTNSRPLSNVWDGNLSTIWHTNPGTFGPPPQYFTICLGDDVEAKLSRIHLWHRTDGYTFAQHNPRYFEVWGTTQITHDVTDADYWWNTEAWKAGWELLGDFECVKPSGLPIGENSADDVAARANGFDFAIPIDKGKVRFVRFVVKETWAKTNAMHMAEIIFYGDDYIDN
jgi:hypothetical protein